MGMPHYTSFPLFFKCLVLFWVHMIAYLNGTIQHIDSRAMIVVCSAVGYEVVVPEYVLLESSVGDTIELYTHQQISSRDDTIELFGFKLRGEIELFKQLTSVSGVGPRSAIGVLSVANLEEVTSTIAHSDPGLLQKVAGIGKKTAERIVIELKDKMVFSDNPVHTNGAVSGSDTEVYEALEHLGYKTPDIRALLKQLPPDLKTSEDKIKAALKLSGK